MYKQGVNIIIVFYQLSISKITTVPFTDNPHCPILSVVSDLLCCSASDITAIPSSPISLLVTSNTLNVALPVMITVAHTIQ